MWLLKIDEDPFDHDSVVLNMKIKCRI